VTCSLRKPTCLSGPRFPGVAGSYTQFVCGGVVIKLDGTDVYPKRDNLHPDPDLSQAREEMSGLGHSGKDAHFMLKPYRPVVPKNLEIPTNG